MLLNRLMTPVARCALAASLMLIMGCSDEEILNPAVTCATMRAHCLESQAVCINDATGPHCESCQPGHYANASGECEAIDGTPYHHEFATFTVGPGQEIRDLCQSWTLNNSEELWVNSVELSQDERSHHSLWTHIPSNYFDVPDGVWPCNTQAVLSAVTAQGGVLMAQSTQATHEVQKFPNGAAVRIPPYSRIISDIHLLNASTETVTGSMKFTMYTKPASDVKIKLAPFEFSYFSIDVLPHATTRFSADCTLQTTFAKIGGTPFDMKIYYLLPHTHTLGTRAYLNILGGPQDGKTLLELDGFNGEAHGRAFDPPLDVAGAKGLSFGCQYDNPTDKDLTYGWSLEMCQFLGFADTSTSFVSAVRSNEGAGMDGKAQLFTGPCETIGIPPDFNMPGGPPPQ